MTAARLRAIHLALAVVWGTVGMAVTVFWLADSILWLGILSVYALIGMHLDGYGAARAEESDGAG